MFCMQMPPNKFRFQEVIFLLGWEPRNFSRKVYPDDWDLMAYKTNPRLVAWGERKQLELTWTLLSYYFLFCESNLIL